MRGRSDLDRAYAELAAITAKPPRCLIAIHEAGHAVVAYLLGADLDALTIVPAEDRRGQIEYDWYAAGPGDDPDQRVRDEMAISLAGRAAVEALVSPAWGGDGCGGDDRHVYEWAQILGGYHPQHAPRVGAIIAEEWERTVALVDGARGAINALATALLRAKTLAGHEAWGIIDAALDRLVRRAS